MRVFLFVILCVLSGCQSTQLHVITDGYTQQEFEAIEASLKQALKDHDIDIIKSEVRMPTTFPNSSIALNPAANYQTIITQLDNWLVSNGHKQSQEFRFNQGNHYYSKDHLGLYLRKQGTQSNIDLPPYLRTQYCQIADGTLALNKHGVAVLEYEINNDHSDDLIRYQGTWSFHHNLLTVKINSLSQTFLLFKETKDTHLGPRQADVFKPQKQLTMPHIFNCEFLIIYME